MSRKASRKHARGAIASSLATVIVFSASAWGSGAHQHDHGSHQHHHSELPTVVQIEDPAGDANYLNNQDLVVDNQEVPLPHFGDHVLPVSADPAADILSVWFSNDARSVSAHIQTQSPPPGVTGILYRVWTNPDAAHPRGCLHFGAAIAGTTPTYSQDNWGYFGNPCGNLPIRDGQLEVSQLADGTGLITITVPREFDAILDSGQNLIEPFAHTRLYVNVIGYPDSGNGQMDNTEKGSDYVFAGSPVESQPFQAGKRAVAHRPGARIVASARTRAAAPRPAVFSTGYPAWEPTLGVDKDGDVFTTSSTGTTNLVLSSEDEGRTWQDISPRISSERAHQMSFDPYLYVDPDTNRVFDLDLQLPSCVELSFSDDKGTSWATRLMCGGADDHPTLFAGPPVSSATVGYPNVVYLCLNQLVTLAVCSKSLDGGSAFVPTGEPAFGLALDGLELPCNGATGHGVADAKGVLYLPRIWCNEQPWLAVSRDEGASWEQIQVAENGGLGHEAAVAVDAEGNIYFTWVSHKDRMPYLAISTDGAKSFGAPMMIGQPGLTKAALPAIDVGDPGKIALVYMGTDAGKRWAGHITISTNALGPKPVFYSTTVNDKSDSLDTSCLHRCELGGDFFDVVIAPDGRVWSAFTNHGAGIVARLVGGPRLR